MARDALDRFMSHVEPEPTSGCWLWTAYVSPDGYGRFRADQTRGTAAHRWAYERHVGPIPPTHEIDHLCHVRCCVNPAHLEPVTHRENVARSNGMAVRNAAKTECPKGHPYDATTSRGERFCRTCARATWRESKRRAAARSA